MFKFKSNEDKEIRLRKLYNLLISVEDLPKNITFKEFVEDWEDLMKKNMKESNKGDFKTVKKDDMISTGTYCWLCDKEILVKEIFYDVMISEDFFDTPTTVTPNEAESLLVICKLCKEKYFPDLKKILGEIVENNMNMFYNLRK